MVEVFTLDPEEVLERLVATTTHIADGNEVVRQACVYQLINLSALLGPNELQPRKTQKSVKMR